MGGIFIGNLHMPYSLTKLPYTILLCSLVHGVLFALRVILVDISALLIQNTPPKLPFHLANSKLSVFFIIFLHLE